MFNVLSEELRKDPYLIYRKLRRETPVCRTEPFGDWAVARHADVLFVLRNPKLFLSSVVTSDPGEGPAFLLHARTLIGSDPPEHTRLRSLISKVFTPQRINSLAGKIRHCARELLVPLRQKRHFDFIGDFAAPLPILVIAEILGIDSGRREDFKRWSNTLISWRRLPAGEAQRNSQEMFYYMSEIIVRRKLHPGEDLISALVQACELDQKLSAEEVLGLLRLLLVAGNETTTNLLGNTLFALISHPDVWDRVKHDRTLVPKVVEESLRYDSPAQCLMRRVGVATKISGVRVEEGDTLLLLLASANHDEDVFDHPEKFDIERNAQPHLAFGGGIHFCLGAPLAKLQAKIAFQEIFESFAKIERQTTGSLDVLGAFFFRGLKSLPVIGRPG